MTMDITKAIKRIPRHVFYKHYRGGIYRVLCVSLRESDSEPVVTYENDVGVVFTRPVSEWEDLVDYGGRFIQRFVRLPGHVEPSNWPPRDDFENFSTPETKVRKQLQEAYDAIKARADAQFLDKLRAMGIPVPRISMKDAAAQLGIDYGEMVKMFEEELSVPKEPTPVPLKMWMAAAGVNLDKLSEDLNSDPLLAEYVQTGLVSIHSLLMASPRFADFCSLSCGELENPYEDYLKYRYPTEFVYLKEYAEKRGYTGCTNWRVCDPSDSQDHELFIRHRTNDAYGKTWDWELHYDAVIHQQQGVRVRRFGFTYESYQETNVQVDAPAFTNVEVIHERVAHKN